MLEYKVFSEEHTKPYVLLLHGIGGSANIFFPQIKEYKKHFNVVAVHLRGHKGSPSVYTNSSSFSFKEAANDVIEVMDQLRIKKAHFVGVSLGTVIIHQLLSMAPNRVETAVMGGAITKINPISRLLLAFGKLAKNVMPYLWLYSLFARVLMPRKNHKESRNAFIKEASQMKRAEFLGWYDIAPTVDTTFENVEKTAGSIPKLYLMGSGDRMFKKDTWKDVRNIPNTTCLFIPNSGHVVNLDTPEIFNNCSISYIKAKGNIHGSILEEKT
ncbi:Pimeloyl-ACP methyl ester carboxylesterase [Halobacillus alkaliphilus]|uniref:Pimeloyl-ACP methyl ester carboxylesterase n=1 Tax=Halobacillus alkaliphilus TaxID=396056 RepID=A0A1I2MNT2_9BACI|nr:alpha/beta hydrolase [Halobacillus alkaliphilus]SFF91046.1 Pimeloyl-ACP methyl ester carboxylesterase [Halobacillus alkaliphilus]